MLCLRFALYQVTAPKAIFAFGLSFWITDQTTCPQELVLIKFAFFLINRK